MITPQTFSQITVDIGSNANDYARAFQVFVSNDAVTWGAPVASGTGGPGIATIAFAPQTARFVGIVQTGSGSNWWSIAEFNVYAQTSVPGDALITTGWVATASASGGGTTPGKALDGNLTTRWTTGVPQANGQWFQVDMLQPQTFVKVVLNADGAASDYPRAYQVYASNDPLNWGTAIATGNGTSSITQITIPQKTARYLKIVQTGSATNWWSIAELTVYGVGPVAPIAVALPRSTWSATASSTCGADTPSKALDDNAQTRWSSGLNQANGQWFRVDMQTPQTFTKITVDAGGSSGDYPRGYQVFTSNDGTNWGTVIASGSGSSQLVTIAFPSKTARYIKIVQTGSTSSNWWSIHELNVYGTTPVILLREGWIATASLNTGTAVNGLDGKLGTRWNTGVGQANGQWYQFDMRAPQTFNLITLNADGNTSDYPRAYQVLVSTDSTNWGSPVATGSGSSSMVSIAFATQTARYVRIVQTGSSSNWWSIAELNVYGPSVPRTDKVPWGDAPISVKASKDQVTGEEHPGEVTLPQPTIFSIPDYIYVRTGNSGNGQTEMKFRLPSGTTVTCSYQGGASVAHPITDVDRMRGRRYRIVSCDNGYQAGQQATATWLRLRLISGDAQDPAHRTSVAFDGGGGCSEHLPAPLAAEEVVEIRDNFAWDRIAKLPETDVHGHPAIFHGLIYIDSKEKLAALNRLRIFWSELPLSERYMSGLRGKCGRVEHATDGRGVVVYAIFPARLFNILRDFAIQALHANVAPPFKFIMPTPPDQPGYVNSDGSLSYSALGSSGYLQWLSSHPNHQAGWFSATVNFLTDMAKDVGKAVVSYVVDPAVTYGEFGFDYASKGFDLAVDFTTNLLDNTWEWIQEGLQEFVLVFSDKVSVHLTFNIMNRDPAFPPDTPFVRVWGPPDSLGARPRVAPGGTQVRVRQWGWGFLPVLDEATMSEFGEVTLEAVKGSTGRGDSDVCVELDADWGMMTSDFIPNEVCDFTSAHYGDFQNNVNDTLVVNEPDLFAFTQIKDSSQYLDQVLRTPPYKFNVLTDWVANEATGVFGPHRAMTLCLDFPGTGAGLLTTIPARVGAAINPATVVLTEFGSLLLEKDLWWPDADDTPDDDTVDAPDSRGVMTHEYGHFAMCSMLFAEGDANALTGLMARLGDEQDDSRDDENALMTEAWADTFAMQVVGGSNYIQYATSSTPGSMHFCTASPCIDQNLVGSGDSMTPLEPFRDELARYQTLIYDAFDTPTSAQRFTLAPSNGDIWVGALGGLQVGPGPYIANPDENVSLGGGQWRLWVRNWLERGNQANVDNVIGGLMDTIKDQGYNWCDRCDILALHDQATPLAARSDVNAPTMEERFARWQSCVGSPRSLSWLGPPPNQYLNMNLQCVVCPLHQFANLAGVCIPCPANSIARGDHCDSCGPDDQPSSVFDECIVRPH
jgi:hypothetical protein